MADGNGSALEVLIRRKGSAWPLWEMAMQVAEERRELFERMVEPDEIAFCILQLVAQRAREEVEHGGECSALHPR